MRGPIALGTIRTSFVLGLRLFVQAGTLLLVARMLGPEGFGAFAGVAALAVLLGVLSSFGTHLVLLGEVSKVPARRGEVLRYAVPLTLLCGNLLLLIYLFIGTFALREAGVSLSVLLVVGIADILLQPLFVLPATEHLALGRTARSQLLMNLPLALRMVAAGAVFLIQPADPLIAFSYGYLISSVLALGVALATMPAPWPRPSSWRLPNRTELRFASSHAMLALTATGPAELDKALATKLLPLSDSGLYASAARIMGTVTLPVIALMFSALPRLFREASDCSERSARLLYCIFVATFAYSVLLSALMWLIAPVFVQVFGGEYRGITQMIHWLCLAMPGMALRIAAGSVLMAIGRPWMRAGFEAAGLAVLVVAAVVFTAHLGTLGMPIALACSEWTMACIGVYLIISVRKNQDNPTPVRVE